ncbi:membrane-spanning 4-domains subfamily A member 13 isoform X3 [Eptesicus fuscus]|uniref:membrane-spanning 4-domains subfamily A member 13 isoform X3 n=1 Tax=Eptesicus fuscus TaxID=29078 RepID=UPI002403FC3D|nr:membrane-spanning 4-domains subfamily A member 13 isoform X3 [Eptesicus fuscus]
MAPCVCSKISTADTLVLGFIISGAVLIKVAKHPTPSLVTVSLILNITCIITVIVAVILTIIELSSFHSVSYRNYGQAKLGREVSRILLFSYFLELAVAFTYSIFGCIDLGQESSSLATVAEEAESAF